MTDVFRHLHKGRVESLDLIGPCPRCHEKVSCRVEIGSPNQIWISHHKGCGGFWARLKDMRKVDSDAIYSLVFSRMILNPELQ